MGENERERAPWNKMKTKKADEKYEHVFENISFVHFECISFFLPVLIRSPWTILLNLRILFTKKSFDFISN